MADKLLIQEPSEVENAAILLFMAVAMQVIAIGLEWIVVKEPLAEERQIAALACTLLAGSIQLVMKGKNWARFLWLIVLIVISVGIALNWKEAESISLIANLDGATVFAIGYAVALMFATPSRLWFLQEKDRSAKNLRIHIHGIANLLHDKSGFKNRPTIEEVQKRAKVSYKIAAENMKDWQPSPSPLEQNAPPPS